MGEVIRESSGQLKEKSELPPREVAASVLEFFRLRFQNFLVSKGTPADVVEAVLEVGFDDVVDCHDRILALTAIKGSKEFAPLAVAFKRVVNISRDAPRREVAPSLFREGAEEKLHQAFLEVRERLDGLLNEKDYQGAMREMRQLKEPVDNFFDRVLVMDEDRKLKDNRLALLGQIADLFSRIADFSKIVTE